MADATDVLQQKEKQSLDFFSAKFDALKALYTKELQPPIPNIQVFNNLGEYARVIKEGKTKTSSQELPTKKASRETNKRTRNLKPEFKPPDIGTRLKAIAATEIAQEDLLSGEKRAGISDVVSEGLSKEKNQSALGLGRAGRPWKKKYMNVLEKMEACSSGPLSILYKCLEKRYKVQVWIRKYKGLRSVLTGYVIAFDKHLNLALMDVDEVYTTEEYHIRENSVAEDKTTRKKKKKKKRKKKNHLKQNGGNLKDTTDKGENILLAHENVYEKSSTDALPSHLNAVSEVKENSTPLTTSTQEPPTGLTSVNDLNKPYNLFDSDNKMWQSKFFNNNGETIKMTSIKDSKNSSSLVRTREVGEAEILSAEQLASIKRQWTAETDQEKKEMPDFEQQIQSTDSMEPMNLESEHTSYLFSHDLTVRVPACDDSDSRDMEFIVVGIFQPASTEESNQDDSVTLPKGLEINVPISFSNSIDKNKDITVNQIEKPEKLIVPVTEPALHCFNPDEASKDKVVQPVNPVAPFTEPTLHCFNPDEASKDKVVQPVNPVAPFTEPTLHCFNPDEASKDKVIQPVNPVIPVTEPALHCFNADETSKDKVVLPVNPVIPVTEPDWQLMDTNGVSTNQIFQTDNLSVIPVSEPVLHGMATDEKSKDKVNQPDNLVIPVPEPVLHGMATDKKSKDKVNQPHNLVIPVQEPILHGMAKDEKSKDKVNQPDNLVIPVPEPILHGMTTDKKSKDKVNQPDNPVIPVPEPVLHSMDTDEKSKDKAVQPDNSVINDSELVLCSLDTEKNPKGQVLQLDNPVIPDLEPVLQSTAQPVESFTTETCIIDEKPLMKYREKRLLQGCDFSNDKSTGIPVQPYEPNGGASCIIEEEVENENSEEAVAHNVSLDKEQNKSLHSHVGQYEDEFNQMEGKNVKEMEERCNGNENINLEGIESFGNKDKDSKNTDNTSATVPKSQGTKGKVVSIIEPEDLYLSQKHEADGFQERNEENSDFGSVLSVNKEDVSAGCQQKDLEENSNTGPKQEETNGRNGKDEREETDKVQPRKGTKGGVGDVSCGDECEKKKEKDEDKAMESEKEEGEITSSSDDEQPSQNVKPPSVQSEHDEARNDTTVKTKKLSVWDRLGKKERATSRHGSEKHEKERRTDRNQASRRNENDEKKLKDRGRRSTRDGEGKQETVYSKETNKDEERDNTRTGDRRRSVGSEKELRKDREDKDVGRKRKQRLIGHDKRRCSAESDAQPNLDRTANGTKREQRLSSHDKRRGSAESDAQPNLDRTASGTKREQRLSSHDKRRGSAESDAQPNLDRRASGTKREQRLSSNDKRRGSAESDAQAKENLNRRVSDKKREQRPGSRGSNEGEKKPSRDSVGSNDQPRKDEKSKTDGGRRRKEPSSRGVKEERDKKERMPSGIVAREIAEQCLASSRREMNPKKQKGEGMEKEQKLSGCEAKQTERREDKGSTGSGKEPRINKEDKNGAKNSRTTRTRQERKKEDKAERTVQSQCDKDGEESSNKLTKKDRQKSSDILKSVQGTHPKGDPKETTPLKQKKHKQPILEEFERSERNRPKPKVQEQAQATQLKELQKDENKHKHSKDSRAKKSQETQSKESSGQTNSKRESKDKKSCQESGLEKPLEKPTTVETNDKQVKLGLLPTPVLDIKTNATSRTGLAAEGGKDRPGFGKSVNESIRSNKIGAKVQKSSETIKKRKLSLENGREGRTKRQKKSEISEENGGTSSSLLEQNKDTSVIRKKDTSDSAPEVKAKRQTTEDDSMSIKKDMGGVGGNPVCTARRIAVGKGKYLEFRRRHVNQLFVRGDNVVMVAYAT